MGYNVVCPACRTDKVAVIESRIVNHDDPRTAKACAAAGRLLEIDEDLMEALDKAWDDGQCVTALRTATPFHWGRTCHEAGLNPEKHCSLCKLWAAYCTWRETRGGL